MTGNVDRQSFFIQCKVFSSQSNSLVQTNVITYNSCLSHHDTGTVVYTEIFSNLRPWMNVDAGLGMGHLRDNTG